ncbi:MAG: pyridoxamine 5'-phosphate oxidase family protein [Rubrobacter sp.]|nr:pyridoxamine 5'-phosphate oxidase family protein [Rubrobacter sp.]
MDGHYITSVEELGKFYDPPSEMVMNKQIDHLDEGCREFLSASPFFLLATFGGSGADCSPRGDGPGFVGFEDGGKTLLIPDRAGNNRIDSLRNIVENPNVGLLFLVPGITYTLRVNGRARLSVEPGLLERFAVKGKTPRSVIAVSVVEAYTQCARALLRADLWNPEKLAEREAVPTMGAMLAAHTKGGVEAGRYDAFDRGKLAKNLY